MKKSIIFLLAIVFMSYSLPAIANPILKIFNNVLVIKSGDHEARFALPDKPFKVLSYKNIVFAGISGKGVFVIDITNPNQPKLLSIVEKGNEIRDIAIKDDALIITTAQYSLKAYEVSSSKPQDVIDSILKDKKNYVGKYIGKVISVNKGWAVISLIPNAPVAPKTRIEIRSSRLIKATDPFSGEIISRPSNEVVFAGDIVEIRDQKASIKLSKGDYPRKGDLAYVSNHPTTGSLYAPKRAAGMFSGFLDLYPQISGESSEDAQGKSYINMLIKAGIYYNGFGPWSIGIELSPFQYMGHSNFKMDDSIGSTLYGLMNYETDLFAVGIGLGYQYPLMATQLDDNGNHIEHNRKGWALVEQARLGSKDGIHALIRYQSVYCRDNEEKQLRGMLGHFYFKIMIPLEMRADLMLEGLTSNTAQLYTLGVRLAFLGMGGPGTMYLKAYMGYMGFHPYYLRTDPQTETSSVEQLSIEGPVVGLGIEQRW